MSILSAHSPKCLSMFKRSMIQVDGLPLTEILDSPLIDEVLEEENVRFGIADEDVFTPAITLGATVFVSV